MMALSKGLGVGVCRGVCITDMALPREYSRCGILDVTARKFHKSADVFACLEN